MNIERIKELVIENKGWAAIGSFLLLMALGVIGLFAGSFTNISSQGNTELMSSPRTADIGLPPGGQSNSGSYVEVQEGNAQIKTESIENSISRIRSTAEDLGGWIESSSKNRGELYTKADLTVKVPSEDFKSFMSQIKSNFDVESYSVQNYRLYTEREEDELDVLNATLNDYENIRAEVKAMENTGKKLDLLMKITEKELEIKEKQRRYQNQLSDKKQRGDYATVRISLREKRKIELVPDDLGQKFRNEFNDMVENVADTLIATLTGGVEIFFLAIKYIFYLLIIAVPASIAYRIGRRIYRKFF